MRKATTIILTLILSVFLLVSFTGCDNSSKDGLPRSNDLPDFANCELGYRLKVYPDFAFDYEMNDGTIVHIESIEATLVEKNEIKKGDIVKGDFFPYNVVIGVSGRVDKSNAGKVLGFNFVDTPWLIRPTVNDDGSFEGKEVFLYIQNNMIIYLNYVAWE